MIAFWFDWVGFFRIRNPPGRLGRFQDLESRRIDQPGCTHHHAYLVASRRPVLDPNRDMSLRCSHFSANTQNLEPVVLSNVFSSDG